MNERGLEALPAIVQRDYWEERAKAAENHRDALIEAGLADETKTKTKTMSEEDITKAMNTPLRTIAAINQSQQAAASARSKLFVAKGKLAAIAKEIDDAVRVEYTGWFVALRRNPDGTWFSLGCLNPDDERWQDEELPDYTLLMPIADPATIPVFDGF